MVGSIIVSTRAAPHVFVGCEWLHTSQPASGVAGDTSGLPWCQLRKRANSTHTRYCFTRPLSRQSGWDSLGAPARGSGRRPQSADPPSSSRTRFECDARPKSSPSAAAMLAAAPMWGLGAQCPRAPLQARKPGQLKSRHVTSRHVTSRHVTSSQVTSRRSTAT